MKKRILVFLIVVNLFLKTLRLVIPNVWWSSLFHLSTTLFDINASHNTRRYRARVVTPITEQLMTPWPWLPLP